MADENKDQEDQPEIKSMDKESKIGWLILGAIIILLLGNIIYGIVVLSMAGYYRGALSGSGWLGKNGSDSGPVTDTPGSGVCSWTEISKTPPHSNLANIVVPVWVSNGSSKTSATQSLRVNANCAEKIENLFKQVYNDSSKPPIDRGYTGCYAPRPNGLANSRHKWGVACDVNWLENWCAPNCYNDPGSRIPSNGWWKPGPSGSSYAGWTAGFDERSIPISGTVVSAFSSIGWGRGLYGGGFNDFMHFSVDGH